MKRKVDNISTQISLGFLIIFVFGSCSGNNAINNKEVNLDKLSKEFISPPDSVKPWVFWQWMNGNVTEEGITQDLEAMQRMGIGGALCFNNAVGIPRGPVDYASEEWMDATEHAAKEADRLGLKIMLHNSPGYSGTGGPWITPEMSMQELVWAETRVYNISNINITLPRHQGKMEYYEDAFVLAYPSLASEKKMMKDELVVVKVNNKVISKSVLCDNNPKSIIRLDGESSPNEIFFEFNEPFEAQSITVYRTQAEVPGDLFDGPRDHPPHFTLEVSSDGKEFQQVTSFGMPQLRKGNTPGMQNFKAVKGKCFRLTTSSPTWVSEVELHGSARLAGWPGKADYTHGSNSGYSIDLDSSQIISWQSVIDVSSFMDDEGKFVWKAPQKGDWTIVRIGHTTTGEENAAHPDAGKGLEIDKLNRAALDFQFKQFNSKVIERLRPYIGKSFQGFTTDSWEAGKQNWSVVLPSEFKNRNNYDITKWVLALTGRIIDTPEETEKFLYDFRQTQVELLAENYYGYWRELCHKQGLQYHAEPYGDGSLDGLKDAQHLDVPMAEFWTRYIYGSDLTSKQAASAAHLYGKPVAAAESFTGMPLTSKWTAHPYALKAEGDWFYTLGINRLIFHVFVHQPYSTGFPGMTMGPFGTHFDRNNTWTNQAYGWIEYLTRTQFILQQGLTVVDACYFKGDEPTSVVPNVYPLIPEGYTCDVFGTDALFNRFSVRDGKIVLPDGMNYQIAIMAPIKAVKLSTLQRFKQLVEEGMTLVVNSKPEYSLGKTNTNEEIKAFVETFYKNLNGETITRVKVGKGELIWGENLSEVFSKKNVKPDFVCSTKNQDAAIHYIHKKIGVGDVYFISNHRRRKEEIIATFRVGDKAPEIWNPETGKISEAPIYQVQEDKIRIPLEMDPAGSCFVVFRSKIVSDKVINVYKEGNLVKGIKDFLKPNDNVYKNVANSFTISAWIKPETFAHGGKSMLFHAPEGEMIYGKGHAACALSAGQNGIFVYERTKGRQKNVLAYTEPLQGWTQVSLVYNKNKPVLFVNGKNVAEGKTSNYMVHPGLLTPANDEQFSGYFEGNYTDPELFKEVLNEEQISNIFRKGLGKPDLVSPVKLSKNVAGETVIQIFENGDYEILNSSGKKQKIKIEACSRIDISNNWEVKFPSESGVKEIIEMPQLESFIKHKNFDVKHFSGTCIYIKPFELNNEDIKGNKRIMIDLGRVEVIAQIFINGKDAGLLWKEPYLADITPFVMQGKNTLKIEVTNLWINRLIGDEYLPEENKYSEHKYIYELPQWYINNQPKPGLRKSFSVWHSYQKDEPLVESGLLGPVQLAVGVEEVIEDNSKNSIDK